MAKSEKTRCSGTWTEARYNSFIKSGIRSLTRKWKPMFDALADAKTEQKINPKTGRLAMHFKCAMCGSDHPVKDMAIDHIESIIGPEGFLDWDTTIERALCEKEGFQVLCKEPCHKEKTSRENMERKTWKKAREDNPREYDSWHSMNRRCYDKNFRSYPWYGEKGIKVCEEWNQSNGISSLDNFIRDMGKRPEGCTLDRIDPEKDYEPANCRWATDLEQGRNTSRNVWIQVDDDLLQLHECEERYGVPAKLVGRRINKGWTPRQAVGLDKKEKAEYLTNLTEEDVEFIRDSKLSQEKTGEALGLTRDQVRWIKKKFNI